MTVGRLSLNISCYVDKEYLNLSQITTVYDDLMT